MHGRQVLYKENDVVIPKDGGNRQVCVQTRGFCRYTNLVNDNAEAYKLQPQKEKRQFVIDNIIIPLLADHCNFFRYNKERQCYDLVDLSNEKNINIFASKVVMQKFRDLGKTMAGSSEKRPKKKRRTSASLPTPTLEGKRGDQGDLTGEAIPSNNIRLFPSDHAKRLSENSVSNLSPDGFFDENFLSEFEDVDLDNLDEKSVYNFQALDGIFNVSTIADDTIQDKKEQRESVTCHLRPLLNVLLSHPGAKYFMVTDSAVNLKIIATKLESKGYDNVSAVEQDLRDIFSNVQANCDNIDMVERISKDFLDLVANYFVGIWHKLNTTQKM